MMVTDEQEALNIRKQVLRSFANNSDSEMIDDEEENDQCEALSERPRKAIYRQKITRE